MKIFLVWARDGYGSTWLVDSWDDDSVAENHEGWVEALAKHRNDHGVDNIAIVTADIDSDAVVAAFEPRPVGELKNVTPVEG